NYPTYGMTPEKVANENARQFLPNACETKVVFTMNGRSLLNFFKHRDCNRGQDEIRELAREMIKECQKVAPVLFKKCGASCRHGKCTEGKMTCGYPLPKWN
ncbi:MAG: FAD-dependent thymidylate synthase, partial [Paraclostridium sp.]